jgi:hypothetical protein
VLNVNETGRLTVANKSTKIIGLKGEKRVGIRTSISRKRNKHHLAARQYVAAFLIPPRARENPDLISSLAPMMEAVSTSEPLQNPTRWNVCLPPAWGSAGGD